MLAACASGVGPEDISASGVYALNGGHLIRLDGSPEMERATWDRRQDLAANLILVAYDPAKRPDSSVGTPQLRLRHVPFMRYQVDARSGDRSEPTNNLWVATDLPSFVVPLNVSPVNGRPGAVQGKPPTPLENGLYTVQFGEGEGATHARFGVGWDDVDSAQYGQSYCIDRFVDGGRYADMPCAAAVDGSIAGLRVGELDPDKKSIAGNSILVVRGAILSEAKEPRRIPRLRASLRDGRGVELDSWYFDAESAYLLPGDATTFSTEKKRPPAGVSKVHVDFAGS